jgi:hypothetical protein
LAHTHEREELRRVARDVGLSIRIRPIGRRDDRLKSVGAESP